MKTTLYAAALSLAIAAPAYAGIHSTTPGELVLPTIAPSIAAQEYATRGEFNFGLVPCTVNVDGRHVPAWAIVPVETASGDPLDQRAAAALMFATHRHFGIFDTQRHALDYVPAISRPEGGR